MDKFRLFVETYKDRLVRHAFYRIGNKEEAEDVVQNIFVKIYQQSLFPSMLNPEAYLYKMTMNACLDIMRKQKAKLQMQFHLKNEWEQISHNGAIHKIRMEEEFKRIEQLLGSLPLEQADVIRFRILDELDFKEIARILEKPESTIKSRFQYGMEKLKKLVNVNVEDFDINKNNKCHELQRF